MQDSRLDALSTEYSQLETQKDTKYKDIENVQQLMQKTMLQRNGPNDRYDGHNYDLYNHFPKKSVKWVFLSALAGRPNFAPFRKYSSLL